MMLDFSNDKTVVWDLNCEQNLTSSASNETCTIAPVTVGAYYNNTNPVYTYNNTAFGGYLTSGQIYTDTFCIA